MKHPISRFCPGAAVGLLTGVAVGCGTGADGLDEALLVAESDSGPLVGGTFSNLRPEIGRLDNCTATLVERRYVITAAHCVGYGTGPLNNNFEMRDTNGNFIERIPVDWSYSLGTSLGATDVAFARLTRNAPTTVTPAGVSSFTPGTGAHVTAFGFGCQARPNGAWGRKQFLTYNYGDSFANCPGDSGGPRVWGAATGRGWIWGINSGYNGRSGRDLNGSTDHVDAREALTAITRMGGTTVTNNYNSTIANWAVSSGVRVVAGDFNRDGRGDLALLGGQGWSTIPVAFGNGAGGFSITNYYVPNFPAWARSARHIVAGDFDGDGDTDIALMGGSGWATVPVAFSNRNGTFRVTNYSVASVPYWTTLSGVQAVTGDFDGDGDDDIALNGGQGWGSIPVAFSNRNGTFRVTNYGAPNFPAWASQGGVQMVAGDFDGDGDADLALSGRAGWGSIPVALSNRNGTFGITNRGVGKFPQWAGEWGVRIVAGDFDGDGDDDIGALGGHGWLTAAFALSNGGGYFSAANLPLPNFPDWARSARHVLAARMNTDATDDLVLLGGSGWATVPVAFVRR